MMARHRTESEDTAVRLAAALDYEDGGQRLRELAARLGRTGAAVRQRASRLRTAQLAGAAAPGGVSSETLASLAFSSSDVSAETRSPSASYRAAWPAIRGEEVAATERPPASERPHDGMGAGTGPLPPETTAGS